MGVKECRAYIENYLAEYGQPPGSWPVAIMAEDLERRLGDVGPGGMRPTEAADFFNRWNGKVMNGRGELVDYTRFLTYADSGIMAAIADGGLTGNQEVFECYSSLHRGCFGVEFPLWDDLL
ncbi:hypothetical protein B5F74_02335 [Collinsella sp. An271]|uniref:hypothetical protein n=1 Tax=Collinsella sp. An271 TaxID=1965616 RepID=UPI000B37D044|nr:hypothetical protein [Collinsella sp. An271]OUO62070.1 hypothetical protein B5F74_02335 [Collinsella sp. An271]